MVVRFAQGALTQQADSLPIQLEVLRLLADEREALEEGDDAALQIVEAIDLPPLPAMRIVPQPSVSRNRSSGARSCCDTLKAAERRKPRALPLRLRQTTMKLASPSANPERKAPRATSIASMAGLSC